MENGELTKEQILNADDIQIIQVDTPEWGGHVYIKSLTVDESYQFSKSSRDSDGEIKDTNLIIEYCSLVICDSEGTKLFNNEDVEQLSMKSTIPIMRIYNEARKLNGEDVEELEKNLEQTQSECSDSD